MTNRILFVILALCLAGVFSAFAQENDRFDTGYTSASTSTIVSEPTTAQIASGTTETILDPRVAAVDIEYSARLMQLKDSYSTAADFSEQQNLQREIEALKLEWSLATSRVQLEIAREAGNERVAAEIQECIDNMTNPPQRTHVIINRDPATGAELEGGSR